MIDSGYKVYFNDIIEAIVNNIASNCYNVDLKKISSNFDEKVVKEWTVTRIILSLPYVIEKTTKYEIKQLSDIQVTQYSKNSINEALNKLFQRNNVSFESNTMNVATFLHAIKLLLKYISESFKLYVSPYYNDSCLVFSPTSDINYSLTNDIKYNGNEKYTDEQIKLYMKNLSILSIYGLPESNIIPLSYTTIITEGTEKIALKANIKYEFTYNSDKRVAITIITSSIEYKVYYKLYANDYWKVYNGSYVEIPNETTTVYFNVRPLGDTSVYYNELGADNTCGFVITKSLTSGNPHTVGVTDFLWYSSLESTTYSDYVDHPYRYRLFPRTRAGYDEALVAAKIALPTGWIDWKHTWPRPSADDIDAIWAICWDWYTDYYTVYDTITTWSGKSLANGITIHYAELPDYNE